MSDRKLIILGTASQVPGRGRNQNGYLLRFDDEGFLFDPGEGTQRQMIMSGVSVSEITKIFISHFHGDHCLGLAGIIQRISLDKVPHEVEIYYPASGREYFAHLRDSSLYHNVARLRECPVEAGGTVFSDNRISIEALPLDHMVDTFGYRIREKDTFTLIPEEMARAGIRKESAGRLKSEGKVTVNGREVHISEVGRLLTGQVFAFIMDTRLCRAAYDLAADADLCIMEATYLSDKENLALDYGHLTAAQAGMIARDARVKRLVLSHYSQRYESTDLFMQEAMKFHPDVLVAKDGDCIHMPRRKRELRSPSDCTFPE